MPKVIDNYVLQDKIGSGQFGDVFKGFNQQTQMLVAIKTIKRETIKGKFYQLLQTQIKVLKTCDNPYIMKLYALKKTANHYYLILQYCNGGDMLGKLKSSKRLQQNQVIKYFCQILTGFQTLVKHKIMHRDFKLANILLHDDNIKIADFGFSKLLNTDDYATTMLGSPLNMAPEVLGGNKYNNKADIWSIGACIYEMLIGKPPYMASNMVDLLKVINTKPLHFPLQLKLNPVLVDVLKKMLVPDVKKRISWNDLFTHPINRFLDNQIRRQIDLQLIEDESLMINTSKYYLKKNLVINKPEDIQEKQKMNQQLMEIIKTGEKSRVFQSQTQIEIQHKSQHKHKKQQQKFNQLQVKVQKDQQKVEQIKKKWRKVEQPLQNFSHIYRKNSKTILHYRNIYAFFAAVVDQTIQLSEQNSEFASFAMIKKILSTIKWLKQVLESQVPQIQNLQKWQQYKQQHEYNQVRQYIQKQENVFLVFCQSLQSNVKSKIIKGEANGLSKKLINDEQISDNDLKQILLDYLRPLIQKFTNQTLLTKDFLAYQQPWKHIQKVLICLNYKREFEVDMNANASKLFDFNNFYEQKNTTTPAQVLLKIQERLAECFN